MKDAVERIEVYTITMQLLQTNEENYIKHTRLLTFKLT